MHSPSNASTAQGGRGSQRQAKRQWGLGVFVRLVFPIPVCLLHLVFVEFRFVLLIWYGTYSLVRQVAFIVTANLQDGVLLGLYLQLQDCYSRIATDMSWNARPTTVCAFNINPAIKSLSSTNYVETYVAKTPSAFAINLLTFTLVLIFYTLLLAHYIRKGLVFGFSGEYIAETVRLRASKKFIVLETLSIVYFGCLILYALITQSGLEYVVFVNGAINVFERIFAFAGPAYHVIDERSPAFSQLQVTPKIPHLLFMSCTSMLQIIERCILLEDMSVCSSDSPYALTLSSSAGSVLFSNFRLKSLDDEFDSNNPPSFDEPGGIAAHNTAVQNPAHYPATP
jgi:hypothetical protein